MPKPCDTCERRFKYSGFPGHCKAYGEEPADKGTCFTDDPEWEEKWKQARKEYAESIYGRKVGKE